MVLGLNQLRNRSCGSVRSHDCQLVYCLVTTRAAYITVGYQLQPALAATAATLTPLLSLLRLELELEVHCCNNGKGRRRCWVWSL